MRRKSMFSTSVVVMSALLLTACGGGSKSSTQVSSGATSSTVESTAESAPESTVESAPEATPEVTEPAEIVMGDDLKYDGYSEVWGDEFDADKLNESDWNIEVHDPGWVNNELQAYVVSDDNIYIEDGKLVLKPIKNGSTYTSGRVNTQGKKDFTYGIFEASIKMPAGQGFLPAFWLMATDENIYGQWPRCGEIDIAEVVGNATDTTYGTIHYGNPHNESQGKYKLSTGDFSTEFHKYAVEWLPGQINWYVDGNLIHSENDWYSKTENIGEITYPAPFDQPFYMILNLAVGGNWPGNPDDTTDFDKATMEIDYVKVYQKDSYDENVEKPEKETTLREPDENGNYVNNSKFDDEDLSDDVDWKFLTANGGEGAAALENNYIHITTENSGTEDYSIQLIQPDMPMEKGSEYEITFKAYASEDRKMKVAVTAPNAGWIRYYPDTNYELTTTETEYKINFTMSEATDPTGRLEFNLGNNDSTADVYITDVVLKKTGEGSVTEESASVLGDGNYVYNSKFQEGEKHLGFWNYEGDAEYEVTPFEDGRRLKITVPAGKTFVVSQSKLGFAAGSDYVLTFDAAAENAGEVTVGINGTTEVVALTDKMSASRYEFTATDKDGYNTLSFTFGEGTYYLDNVRLLEDVMIKNGSFQAGMSGYEVYVDSSADAQYVVDSLTEDNAMDFTINATGDQDWKIQLKQNDVALENGKSYKLTFSAKSNISRKIRVIMQGQENRGWAVYSGENTVELTEDFQTFTTEFTMQEKSDAAAFLSVCLGAVDGIEINETHRVVIDNISLVEVE